MRYQRVPSDSAVADLLLEACDGSSCRYQFNSHGQLTCVTSSTGQQVQYRYDSSGNLVHREDDEGTYLTLAVDPATSRVISQSAPLATDGTPVLAMQYKYRSDETEAVNAAGESTVYRLADGHVVAIDTQIDRKLYRQERFHWKDNRLTSYAVLNSDGNAVGVRDFGYDKRRQMHPHDIVWQPDR